MHDGKPHTHNAENQLTKKDGWRIVPGQGGHRHLLSPGQSRPRNPGPKPILPHAGERTQEQFEKWSKWMDDDQEYRTSIVSPEMEKDFRAGNMSVAPSNKRREALFGKDEERSDRSKKKSKRAKHRGGSTYPVH